LNIGSAKITTISRGLIDLGFIEEVPEKEERLRGRPAVPLRLSRSGGYSFGATLHKGTLEIALLRYNGEVVDVEAHKFTDGDPKIFAAFVGDKMHELARKHNLLANRMLGLGISVAGPAMSADRDHWWTIDELSDWRDLPLSQYMESELGVPVWIENDANAAAIAEFHLGGLMGSCRTAIVIFLGYGIGAGIIVDGNIIQGEKGGGGEIGMLYPGHRPRPSTLDLLSTLESAGFPIASIADLNLASTDQQKIIDQWTVRAASQLELLIKSGFAWFDPGAIIISSPLPAPILRQVADLINSTDLFEGQIWARVPHVAVSDLGGSASTFGAALLPIHALAHH
jgi:predicted NBD/HSP70 family sugar kinase